jgi:hypothetical protein
MPSCTRFASLALASGLGVYVLLVLLAEFVQPQPREIATIIDLPSRPAEVGRPAGNSTQSAPQLSFYQSLQGLPLSGR